MSGKLQELTKLLDDIRTTIDVSNVSGDSFSAQYGWNHAVLNTGNITDYIYNFLKKLNGYQDELSDTHVAIIDGHIQQLTLLHTNIKAHFNANANHLIHIVPVTINTLHVIFQDLECELLSWEKTQDKTSLPRPLGTRLKSTRTRIDNLNTSCADLESKVKTINDAHEAAELLPTDLKELRDAKEDVEKILTESKRILGKIESAQTHAGVTLKSIKDNENESKNHRDLTEKYVAECDDALQITTTQGLAAGFDQKAKSLSKSIYLWMAVLLLALGAGGFLGYVRVNALTEAIKTDLSSGQAIVHAIISIFAIGGPIWLAWLATAQINQRFKLAEDYAYKATVAKSFTGFNKHAERFNNDTAERLFNSTLDRFDEMPLRLLNGKDYNSPWHELLDSPILAKAIDSVPEVIDVLNRYGDKAKLKGKVTKANVTPIKPKNETPEPNTEATA